MIWTSIFRVVLLYTFLIFTGEARAEQSMLSNFKKHPDIVYTQVENIVKNGINSAVYPLNNGKLIFDACDFQEEDGPAASGIIELAILMARTNIEIGSTMKHYGYPQALWHDPFYSDSANILKRIVRGDKNVLMSHRFEKAFLRKIAEARKANPSLPQVIYEGACGGGGAEITFKTKPSGGKIRLISALEKELCKKSFGKFEQSSCDVGETIADGDSINIFGRTYYWGQWKKRDGSLFTIDVDEKDLDKVRIVRTVIP